MWEAMPDQNFSWKHVGHTPMYRHKCCVWLLSLHCILAEIPWRIPTRAPERWLDSAGTCLPYQSEETIPSGPRRHVELLSWEKLGPFCGCAQHPNEDCSAPTPTYCKCYCSAGYILWTETVQQTGSSKPPHQGQRSKLSCSRVDKYFLQQLPISACRRWCMLSPFF